MSPFSLNFVTINCKTDHLNFISLSNNKINETVIIINIILHTLTWWSYPPRPVDEESPGCQSYKQSSVISHCDQKSVHGFTMRPELWSYLGRTDEGWGAAETIIIIIIIRAKSWSSFIVSETEPVCDSPTAAFMSESEGRFVQSPSDGWGASLSGQYLLWDVISTTDPPTVLIHVTKKCETGLQVSPDGFTVLLGQSS